MKPRRGRAWETTEQVLHAILLVVVSTMIGVFLVMVTAKQHSLPFDADVLRIGAAAGLALSPCLLLFVRGRGAGLCFWMILLGTAAATLFGGYLLAGPLGNLLFGVAAYVSLAALTPALLNRWYPDYAFGICPACGYDRSGLPAGAPCAECGHPPTRSSS